MAKKTVQAPKTEDLHKKITDRAHAIYLKRMKQGIHGTAESDWLQAEKEIKEESAKKQ